MVDPIKLDPIKPLLVITIVLSVVLPFKTCTESFLNNMAVCQNRCISSFSLRGLWGYYNLLYLASCYSNSF